MADIINPVSYSEELESLIASISESEDYNCNSWSSTNLQVLRVHIRNHYRIQQQGICAYCKNPVSLHSAANCHVEHIAPKSKYLSFMFEPKNFCVACADCNEIKKDQETLSQEPDPIQNGDQRVRYPRAASAFYIVHPHFDNYNDHIEIFNGHYVDKTEKGHFTIGACKLNRRLRVFGWEESLISEPELNGLMTEFLGADDAIVKNEKLQSIKRALIKIK